MSATKHFPLIGRHVSAAGGVPNAPERAAKVGCNCFQIFSRSPRGGAAPVLTPQIVADFKANMAAFSQRLFTIHTPYYINLASKNNRIRHGSIEVIRDELERGTKLGAHAVMTHIGSAKEYADRADAVAVVVESVKKILYGYTGTTRFLLENAAGAGDVLGVGFEELEKIITDAETSLRGYSRSNPEGPSGLLRGVYTERSERARNDVGRIGICLDTCHAFASGYDVRTKAGVEKMVKEFDRTIGIARLVMLHANDSKTDFDSRRDRHEHIGDGKIGKEGFRALLHHPKLRSLPFILETEEEPYGYKRDVEVLKKLRAAKF